MPRMSCHACYHRRDTMRPANFLLLLTCAGLALGSWASNEPGEPLPSLPPRFISELCALLTWDGCEYAHAWGREGRDFAGCPSKARAQGMGDPDQVPSLEDS